ncbi:cytochrome P450 [Lentzea sp. NBRC 105346]|uniref:cytochrome P450 n=1 Tax=Lentzea sp. NBRC 105346 TaxID=3032205 RepID=UPI0024A2E2A2|nr:cytochrome P450 [Lentzea sp. NBRC 105346]GLZ28516.1 cytochrome P450 [Lentzea sp. NBRC 105346]
MADVDTKPPSGLDGGVELRRWLDAHRSRGAMLFAEEFGMWHVFRHAEAKKVLSDPATFSNDTLIGDSPEMDVIRGLLQYDIGMMDPPKHRTMRSFVNQAFTPRVTAQLEPQIAAITSRLLSSTGPDLVAGLTDPLPVTVIASLLGVPDQDMLHSLVDALFSGGTTEERMSLSPSEQVALLTYVKGKVDETHSYLVSLCRSRRKSPAPGLLNSLIESEVDGVRLSDDEIAGFARALLVAGHVTTKLLLGNCLLYLGSHPSIQADLRADPSGIPAAVEEIFRLRPPLVRVQRLARSDVSFEGVTISKDQSVSVWIAAANRDPLVFSAPDEYRPGRSAGHLGFGHGIHFCVGAPLTRLETRVALRAVLERFPSYTVDSVEFHDYSELIGPGRLVIA